MKLQDKLNNLEKLHELEKSQRPNMSEMLGALRDLGEIATAGLEQKFKYHNFHDIGTELQILTNVYIVGQELTKIDEDGIL